MTVKVIKTKSKERKTAALPRSLARLDKSCWEKEILSIAASTLELRSSTINKINKLPIINIFSIGDVGKKNMEGKRSTLNRSSCLKALSSLKAKTKPERLFINAKKSLLNPVFFLWGLSLKI